MNTPRPSSKRTPTYKRSRFSVLALLLLLSGTFGAWAPAASGQFAQSSPHIGYLLMVHTYTNAGQVGFRYGKNLSPLALQRGIPLYNLSGGPGFAVNWSRERLFNGIDTALRDSKAAVTLFEFDGHGGRNGWDNTVVGRRELLHHVSNSALKYGKDVVFIDDSCQSGNCLNIAKNDQIFNKHFRGIITSSPPRDPSYTGQFERFLERSVNNFDTVDINKDGIATLGELERYARTPGTGGGPSSFAGDNTPIFFRQGKFKGPSADHCLVITPGQDIRYGRVFPDPSESDTNRDLRLARRGLLTDNITDAKKELGGGVVRREIVPDQGQADLFIYSGGRYYFVDGARMQPGDYEPGTVVVMKVGTTQQCVKVSEECTFSYASDEEKKQHCDVSGQPGQPGIGQSIFSAGGGGGGGAVGGGGGGPGGALGQILAPLLGQLLAGGQQRPPSSPAPTLPPYITACPPTYTPVCAADGQTYFNQCVAQQEGKTVVHPGVCQGQEGSPVSAAPPSWAASALQQIPHSGIPSSLLDGVIRVVASLITSVLKGTATIGETIVQ